MLLFWLIFVVPVLLIFFGAIMALIFGLNAVACALQKKQNIRESASVTHGKKPQPIANQVAAIAILSLCTFLSFLALRYWLT